MSQQFNKALGKKARHRARRLALQGLYQWNYSHNEIDELLTMLLETQRGMKLDRAYFERLTRGVVQEVDKIDKVLESFLDRRLGELNPIELAILRIASYEMLFQVEIPYTVIINEAVELAKSFGADQGHRYVNAVLDKVSFKYRRLERC